MNSADKIKKGLEVHSNFGSCADDCPYDAPTKCGYSCSHTLTADSLTLIQQHEANWQQVSNALCGKENATLEEVLRVIDQVTTRTFAIPPRSGKTLAAQQAQRIAELEQELAAVKRERDAAVDDLSSSIIKCDVCKHGRFYDNDCIGLFGDGGCSFEWRSVCLQNTEVQEDA